MTSSQEKAIKYYVKEALDRLYEKDLYLIVNNPHGSNKDRHVSERGIIFRFGIYLDDLLRNSEFSEYNIDCEYNRNMYEKKKLPSFKNGTLPDLIVHKRGSNKDNLLVLEFKTWWNSNATNDEKKIKQFMDKEGNYKYQMGASIILEKELERIEINWL